MSGRTVARMLLILLTIGIMVAIYLFSSQTGAASNELSMEIAKMLFRKIGIDLTTDQIEWINLLLRKIAHFSLYGLLGVGTMGISLTTRCKKTTCILISLLVCGLFAGCDELHQFLSGTRNGNPVDVILDCCGAAVGCLMTIWILRLLSRGKQETGA